MRYLLGILYNEKGDYQRTHADVAMSSVDENMAGLTLVDKVTVGYRKALSLIALERTDESLALAEELRAHSVNSVYHNLLDAIPALAQNTALTL